MKFCHFFDFLEKFFDLFLLICAIFITFLLLFLQKYDIFMTKIVDICIFLFYNELVVVKKLLVLLKIFMIYDR